MQKVTCNMQPLEQVLFNAALKTSLNAGNSKIDSNLNIITYKFILLTNYR